MTVPLNVTKSSDFNQTDLKNNIIAVLPPETGDAIHRDTAIITLQALIKKDFKNFKIISPIETKKLIKEKNLYYDLKRVYSLYGDVEDNIFSASLIGKSLGAKYTVYSKITNVVFTGENIYDTEITSRYNPEYNATEEVTSLRTRYFRRTTVSGFVKIVDNNLNSIIWQVENYSYTIEKLRGFKTVEWDEAMINSQNPAYLLRISGNKDFPSASRAIFLFYQKIFNELN